MFLYPILPEQEYGITCCFYIYVLFKSFLHKQPCQADGGSLSFLIYMSSVFLSFLLPWLAIYLKQWLKKLQKQKTNILGVFLILGELFSSLCPMLVIRFCRHPLLRKSLSSLTFLIAIFNLQKLNSFTLADAFTYFFFFSHGKWYASRSNF